MQASTRARNNAVQGRNFPDRPRLGNYQRPTSSRASLARSGPPTPAARRADGAAETLAQALDLDVVIFWPAPRAIRPRWSAASMTPRQDVGKAEMRSDELGGGAGPVRLGRADFSRI
jgi:hypothetical protein